MIRGLKRTDIPSLMEFFYTDRNVEQDDNFNYNASDLINMLKFSHILQYVWEDDNKVAGYLCAYDMGVWGLLDVLIVRRDYRNKLIGTKLVQTLINNNSHWEILETSYYPEDIASEKYLDKLKYDSKETLIWIGKQL